MDEDRSRPGPGRARRAAILLGLALLAAAAIILLRGRGAREAPGGDGGEPPSVPIAAVGPAEAREPGAAAHTGAVPAGSWTVAGRIVGPGGEPVAAAKVRLEVRIEGCPVAGRGEAVAPREGLSGAKGRFEVPGAPPGVPLRLVVDAGGFAVHVERFEIAEPPGPEGRREDRGDIALSSPAALAVRVIGEEGEPLEDAWVRVGVDVVDVEEDGREAVAAGGGEYRLDRLPAEEVRVRAGAPGHENYGESTVLPRERPLVVRLTRGSRVSGRVVALDGKPVAGARVEARDPEGIDDVWGRPSAVADGEGRFVLEGLTDFHCEIAAVAEGYARGSAGAWPGKEDAEVVLLAEAVLEGTVVDPEGSPVAGAKVQVGHGPPRATDGAGRFRVGGIGPGPAAVAVDREPYLSIREGPVEFRPGERIERSYRLEEGASLAGRVVDGECRPVEGARVMAFPVDAGSSCKLPGRSAWAGNDGRFLLRGIPEGECRVQARLRGAVRAETMAKVPRDGATDLTLTIEAGETIAGRVVTSEGDPVPGADVRARLRLHPGGSMEDWTSGGDGETDRDGRFRIPDVVPSKGYDVTAGCDGFSSGTVSGIEVAPGMPVEGVEIVLHRTATIRGQVLDARGDALEGADVELDQETRGSEWKTSDTDGGFEFSGIEAGTCTLQARLPGRLGTEEKSLEVAAGDALEGIDLRFGQGETLAGRVADAEERPIAAARVHLRDNRGGSALTGPDGRFRIEGIVAGPWELFVEKEGFLVGTFRGRIPGPEPAIALTHLGRIEGQVRAAGREWYPGGTIEVWVAGGAGLNEGRNSNSIDAAGRFSIQVTPGRVLARAVVPGFAAAEAEVDVGPGERREVLLDLRPGGTVRGKVVGDGSGSPLERATVFIVTPAGSRTGSLLAEDFTPDFGAFEIRNVPAGMVILVAEHEVHATTRVPVEVRAGAVTEATVRMPAFQGLHGEVTLSGRPFAGAAISVRAKEGTFLSETMAGSDGLWEIPDLPPGSYEVEAAGAGLRRRVEAVIGKRGAAGANLELGAARLAGTVRRDGAPAGGITISALWKDGEEADSAESDASGRYSLEVPGPGDWILVPMGEDSIPGPAIEVTVPPGTNEVARDIDLPPR